MRKEQFDIEAGESVYIITYYNPNPRKRARYPWEFPLWKLARSIT